MAARYAIIKTGGKQYRVSEGDTLRVEKLSQSEGEISFDEVLLVGGEETKVGAPRVEGASVSAKILTEGRRKKIVVFKKNRRKGYHKKQGHRQSFTELQITQING